MKKNYREVKNIPVLTCTATKEQEKECYFYIEQQYWDGHKSTIKCKWRGGHHCFKED